MSTPQADYDQPLKWIAEHDPDGLLALLGQRATRRKSLSTELPATMRRPDLVWEVERPNGQTGVIHIELQTKVEEDIGQRLAEYGLRIWLREHLPVRSVVVFFRPGRKLPRSPFGWSWDGEEESLRYQFHVVKLWELQPELVLHSAHDTLWPLAGIMGRASVDQLDKVAEHIIEAPLPRQRQGDLVSLLLDIAGLRLKRADVLEVIRRHPIMNDLINESSFTEVIEELRGPKWKEEGRLTGMREMAQGVLESRFVTVPADVLAALNTADEATLRALIPAISTESLEEVRTRLGLNTN